MEEARQHSALTAEQRLFAAIYHVGSLVLAGSICFQIFRRIDALFPAVIVVGFSRICLAVWQLAQQDCSRTVRTPAGLVFNMVTWASAILLLIWTRRYGAA